MFKSDLRKFSRIRDKFILGGDFNCRNQSWGCLRANCWGNIQHYLISTNNFSIVYPTEPTLIPTSRNSNPSVLYYFITNVPDKLPSALTLNRLSSDHLPVLRTFYSTYQSNENLKYDYKNANWISFKRFIDNNGTNFLNLPLNNTVDIDLMVSEFTSLLQNAIETSVPK